MGFRDDALEEFKGEAKPADRIEIKGGIPTIVSDQPTRTLDSRLGVKAEPLDYGRIESHLSASAFARRQEHDLREVSELRDAVTVLVAELKRRDGLL